MTIQEDLSEQGDTDMKVVNHVIALSTVLIASVGIASSDAKSDMIDFASGTGMLIDKSYVLTASHVIDDADEILVEFSDSVSIKATVYRKNAEEDWAVLKLDAECEALPISYASKIQLGDKIYTLGFPSASLLGKSIKYTDGSVSALTGMMDDAKRFQISAPIQPGNSGGPIFDEKGRVVGIVLSCLDPRKFFQHTGGALPQAVNFGLKIQNVVAQTTGISFVKDENRTVTQNHKSTCFIRTRQKISLDKPSIFRKDGVKTSSTESDTMGGSNNSVFDYSKVSQRYRQLAQYLENVANGRFATLGGDALDTSREEGITVLEVDIEKANKFLIIEGLSLFLHKATELSKATIEGQTLQLYSKAKDSLWELKKKNGLVNHKWGEQTFWGLKLGSKIKVDNKISAYNDVYVDNKLNNQGYVAVDSGLDFSPADIDKFGIKAADANFKLRIKPASLDERERRLADHEEWPVLIFPCKRRPSFRGSDDFCLITSLDGVLIGIHWIGENGFDSLIDKMKESNPKEIVELFESKYKIHFHRKLPKEFSSAERRFHKGEYGFLTFKNGICKNGIDRTPYAYEDKDVRIYIRAAVGRSRFNFEEVVVFLSNFEEIITQGKLKVETERLSKPADIPGSDSL